MEKLKAILGLLFLVVVAVLVAAFAILGRSSNTALSVNPAVKFVGMTTPVTVHLTNPHGVRRVSAFLEQNGARYAVYEQTAPARLLVWNRHEPPRTVTFQVSGTRTSTPPKMAFTSIRISSRVDAAFRRSSSMPPNIANASPP